MRCTPTMHREEEKMMKEEGGGPGAAPHLSRPQVPGPTGADGLGPFPESRLKGKTGGEVALHTVRRPRTRVWGARGGCLPPEPGDPTPSSPLPQERGREPWVKPEGEMHEGTGKPGADRALAPDPTLHLPVTASLTGDGGELLN